MRKSKFRKGLVVGIILLFFVICIHPTTVSISRNFNIINIEGFSNKLNSQNNPPIINRTYPPDGAEDILVTGIPINAEVYDSDDDDLWVEVWSNFTGNWVEYAGWDLVNESGKFVLNNISSFIVVDFNEDGKWNLLDLVWLSDRGGWGWSGIWGFFENMSVTDDWGMTSYSTTYYWSVNVTDNFTWTNVTYHFSTKSIGFDVVYVDDDFNESTPGWGYDHFDNIQDGIDAVNLSGTVYVYNGTYNENIIINKTINLIGEDRSTTIIDGGGSGDVVYVSVNWVNVSGFTIRNSGNAGYPNYDAGVEIRSNYSTIIGNIVTGNNRGIWISANNNYVVDNEITSNNAQGIEIYLSRNNTIADNNVSSNTKAGIQSDNSSNNTIISNTVNSNNWHGIFLDDFSSSNTITSNNISSNDNGICIFDSSDGNIIYHNNFIDNTQNAYDECTNNWYNASIREGNYWSDFDEHSEGAWDNDSDGIVDSPYDTPGGNNQDLYPLMHHFELYFILDIILENSEVEEGTDFNVIIKSKGGTTIPNAIVEFNDEQKITGLTGTVHFTAPQVGADTYYDIIAIKEGYAGDTETILVKDVPVEFVSTFMFGRITNLNTTGEHITFEAVNVRTITLSPFSFISYTSGELITILKDYTGLLGALFGVQFIFATCDASIG